MDILNFIFQLGVVFAIFSFLWFLIHLGILILTGNRRKSVGETYLIKFVRYFFLVDVTVLFCYGLNDYSLALDKTVVAGLVLFTYFLGKLQNAQLRTNLLSIKANAGFEFVNNMKPVFNFKAESLVIGASIALFVFLIFYPEYSENPISTWFYESIVDIEDTPVFGFIFKVIGFFFMLSIILKVVNSVMTLIVGKSLNQQNDDDSDDDYDNYEEVK